MVRALYLFLLGAVFYWALKGFFGTSSRGRTSPAQGEEMVPDPQCGVYIPKSRAISVNRGGRQLFFCSEDCRKKYFNRDRKGV